jgi:hypothetical protein
MLNGWESRDSSLSLETTKDDTAAANNNQPFDIATIPDHMCDTKMSMRNCAGAPAPNATALRALLRLYAGDLLPSVQ